MKGIRLRKLRDKFNSTESALPVFRRFPIEKGKKEYAGATIDHAREAIGLPSAIDPRPGTAHPELYVWSRIRLILREPFLEFWGSFLMVLFGNSTLAQTYLSNEKYGSWLNICFGWACGIMFGIFVAGDSGAYLNPAVTLTNCLFRGLPLKRVPTYVIAQLLGMFAAAWVVYGNYKYAIDQYEGGADVRTIPPSETTSATIFCTFPTTFVPKVSQIFSEFIANFVNIFCIFAMRDENGADLKGGGWFVMALFWLNFGLIGSFGWETGSPINPARDLTGRILLTIVGYPNPWTAFDRWSWIPIVIPFVATVCGAYVYDMFVFTGESPVNTEGMGFIHVYKKIHTKRHQIGQLDEEKGVNKDQSDINQTTLYSQDDELSIAEVDRHRHEQRDGQRQEVQSKDVDYDREGNTNAPGGSMVDDSNDPHLKDNTNKNISYDS